ncbi:MAG: peptidoglycan DD-metalloendopeptidase family protein [Clostridia bacterium]
MPTSIRYTRLVAALASLVLAVTAIAQPTNSKQKRGDPWICNDYHSHKNCIGKPYLPREGPDGHRGMDFGADAGTEVLSATYGTVVKKTYDACPGHGIIVATDLRATKGLMHDGQVFAFYAHTEGLSDLSPGQDVRPGQVIGHVIPLRKTECYASREHVHYELRVGQKYGFDIDPNAFWADGPGKPTCFREGAAVAPGKTVAPIRCRGAS